MKINKVKKIDKGGLYTGYIWRSNAKDPEIINGNIPEDLQNLDFSQNPFIIEAQLIDKDKMMSYSVKYADGEYYAYQYDLEEVKKNNIENLVFKEFQSHRMGSLKLQFVQHWTEKEDKYCERMQVLQPAELIFVGFKEEEKKS